MATAGYLFLDAESPLQRGLIREEKKIRMREALERAGLNQDAEYTLYIDELPENSSGERVELAEIMRKAEAGTIQTIIFGSLSELNHDFIKSIDLIRTLALKNIRIICIDNNIDTDSFAAPQKAWYSQQSKS